MLSVCQREPVCEPQSEKPEMGSMAVGQHYTLAAVEAVLMVEEQAIARNDLRDLASLHRPELLGMVQNLTQQRFTLLTELWEVVCQLKRSDDPGDIIATGLDERVRELLQAQRDIVSKEEELAIEIMWRDFGGEG